jgi:hypothetical protein
MASPCWFSTRGGIGDLQSAFGDGLLERRPIDLGCAQVVVDGYDGVKVGHRFPS